ncbi:MAG: cob(I)yrinic acid a,c-diamide adenosyltransferase [Syntrophaceae bacterium]|nr:cob(I)yrinic acid a,c-diamide adenosyltransferase [Syntrophaceae bacterium]
MKSQRRVLLFTGDGKGKTTAALGMVLRAAGHGLHTCIIQFIKNDPTTGEKTALTHLPGVELIQVGRGFVPPEDHIDFELHRQAVKNGLAIAKDRLAKGDCDLLILDEICTACAINLITPEEVTTFVANSPPGCIIVLTGRSAPDVLIEMADTVTIMTCKKHGFQKGIEAQKGVEY